MKLISLHVIAGACCLLVPVALHAQTAPTDPMAPTSPAASPSSTVGNPNNVQPSPTNTQVAPGIQHQYSSQSAPNMASGGGLAIGDDPQAAKDKMFLADASKGGMSEVQMGQLASEKADSPKVKAFGQRMVTDHTELNNQLKPFADKMGVPPPSKLNPDDQAELDKLKGLSGSDFDKEYVAYMIKDHAKDLKDFSKEAYSASDPDLKTTVMRGQKVIQMHKQMVDRLGASMNVTASM